MINVSYLVTFGEVFGRNQDGTKWKVLFHPANMKCGAFVYHFKKDGKKYAQLWNFLMDAEHIRRIMKNEKTLLGDEVYKVRLNVYYKEARMIVEACAKSGYETICYYKEPKKK